MICRRRKPASGAGALAAVLRLLAEKLGLQPEDVVEDSVDAATFEAVVGDHSGALEMVPESSAQRPIHPRAAANLRLLEQLQTAVQSQLAEPVLAHAHVPRSSTLPAGVTRDLTTSSAGSG